MSSESMKLKISKGIKILYIYKNGKQEKKIVILIKRKCKLKVAILRMEKVEEENLGQKGRSELTNS